MAANSQPWRPRKYRPEHLRVLRLYFMGKSQTEIAALTNYTPQHISNIINLPESEEILNDLHRKTIDTIMDIQADVQMMAPAVLEEKFRLALSSVDERVRNVACSDILAIAGHSPIKRIQMERVDSFHDDPYEGMSEEQLRQKLIEETLKSQIAPTAKVDDKATVH